MGNQRTRMLLCLVPLVFSLAQNPGLTAGTSVKRVNETSNGVQPSESAFWARASRTGRFVAFTTSADLVPRDDNSVADSYVKDLKTGKVQLASARSNGNEGNMQSTTSDMSGNGRYVVFFSASDNLVPNDDNDDEDVFVHDRTTGKTKRVSVKSNGNEGPRKSQLGSISADGRFIAFRSDSALVSGDDSVDALHPDIYIHDRSTGRTRLVSKTPSGDAVGDTGSLDISEDGKFVVFDSYKPLGPGDDASSRDIYRWSRRTGNMKIVSVNSAEEPGNGFFGPSSPRISGDGKYVLFESDSSNMSPGDAGDDKDLFVRNVPQGKTRRATVGNGGVEPNSDFGILGGDISANGRWVTFSCFATNLISEDNNGETDVFVRDMGTQRTRRVSLTIDGGEPDGDSSDPFISGDGKHVVFNTSATNFLREDDNGAVLDVLRIGPLQ